VTPISRVANRWSKTMCPDECSSNIEAIMRGPLKHMNDQFEHMDDSEPIRDRAELEQSYHEPSQRHGAKGEKSMRVPLLIVGAISSTIAITAVFAQSQ